jgi:hypothetical protein
LANGQFGINTRNTSTGNLTLSLTGADADAFVLPSTTLSNLPVGGETEITISLSKEAAFLRQPHFTIS